MTYVARGRVYQKARQRALSELHMLHRREYEELLEAHLISVAEELGYKDEVRKPSRAGARLTLLKGSG